MHFKWKEIVIWQKKKLELEKITLPKRVDKALQQS
jgi:hypothetical protein